MFLSLDAILFGVLQENWPEYQLYIRLKEFTLITFASSTTISDAPKLTSLAKEIVPMFTKLAVHVSQVQAKKSKKKKEKQKEKKKTKQGGSVYPKLHQLLHYGDLLLQYGPLLRYSTHRYERKHIYSKSVARVMRNFVNPAKSVHEKMAMNRALYDESISFVSKNFWDEKQVNRQSGDVILSELPGISDQVGVSVHYQELRSKDWPFRLSSKVVRRIISGPSSDSSHQWFRTKKFYQNKVTKDIFCSGYVLCFQTNNDDDSTGKRLRQMNESKEIKFIRAEYLHYSSDFVCRLPSPSDDSQYDCFFIEWIY